MCSGARSDSLLMDVPLSTVAQRGRHGPVHAQWARWPAPYLGTGSQWTQTHATGLRAGHLVGGPPNGKGASPGVMCGHGIQTLGNEEGGG